MSEEGFAEQPERAPYHLTRLLERGNATVVSSHGPVLPVLLEQLAAIADSGDSGGPAGSGGSAGSGDSLDSAGSGGSGENAAKVILEAARRGMGKGEALIAHLVGTGLQARVVDVELCPAP